MGRLLAVDLGTKRIGLALSDPMKIIASPYGFIRYINEEKLIDSIKALCKEKEVEKVIVGYPLLENGGKSKGCLRSERFTRRLREEGIESVLWDERYSSIIAESIVKEYGKTRKNSKDKIDGLAASVILESYLSAHQVHPSI